MSKVKTIVIKEKDFVIKPFSSVIIGDPLYLENIDENSENAERYKKLVYADRMIRKRDHSARVRLKVMETSAGEMRSRDFEIVIVSANNSDKASMDILFDTLLNNRYHKQLLKQELQLGCDTARFYINVDGKNDTISTGADGEFGHVLIYRDKLAYGITLILPEDLYTEKELEQRIRYLFCAKKEGDWKYPNGKEIIDTVG